MALPHGCDGLSARWMAMLWQFRQPSRCRHVRRELLRNAWLDCTPIIPATACHQRNYVETYSRSNKASVESLQGWTGRTQRLRNPHGGIYPSLLQIHTGEVLTCKPQALKTLPMLELTSGIRAVHGRVPGACG